MHSAIKRNALHTEKPRLDAFYDIRPGNGAGLFSKEKTSKEGKKYKKVKK